MKSLYFKRTTQKHDNVTLTYVQLRLFGLPLMPKSLLKSVEKLEDGNYKYIEYYGGKKLLEGTLLKSDSGQKDGLWTFFRFDKKKEKQFITGITVFREGKKVGNYLYNDEGVKVGAELWDNEKFITEAYEDGVLFSRRTLFKDGSDKKEKFSVRTGKCIVCTIVDEKGKENYNFSEDGKLLFSRIERNTFFDKIKFVEEKSAGGYTEYFICVPKNDAYKRSYLSRKDMYKAFVSLLSYEKSMDDERQKTILKLRSCHGLAEKKDYLRLRKLGRLARE